MKQWKYIGLIAFAILTSNIVEAQETNNISNRYGPPNYTGGTVNTTSEAFAAAQVYERQAQLPTQIESVYPNPARSNAAIVLQDVSSQPVTIYITDMNGVIEKTYTYGAGYRSYGFDMGNLRPGVYRIQVQERGKSMQSIELLRSE